MGSGIYMWKRECKLKDIQQAHEPFLIENIRLCEWVIGQNRNVDIFKNIRDQVFSQQGLSSKRILDG